MFPKHIVLRSPGTHFMDMRAKIDIRVTEVFYIILILNNLSSNYFVDSFGAFFTLKFSSNTGTNFSTF